MKKLLLLLLCLFSLLVSESRDLSTTWSKNVTYDPNTTGQFMEFAGANSKYVYGVFAPKNSKLNRRNRILIAYDKSTMKQMGRVSLNSGNGDFEDIHVTEEVIYVLILQDSKGKEELYAQTYTPTLEVISKRNKIYQAKTSSSVGSLATSSIGSFINIKANSNLYLVSERPNSKDENVVVDYNVIDASLSIVYTGQIELPVKSTRTSSSKLSYFSVGDDGMLLAQNLIKADKEIRKGDKVFNYWMLSVIDPGKKTIKSLPVRASGKHIVDFEFFSRDNKLQVAGIYSESIGKRSERGNGVFSATLNEVTGELEGSEFTEIKAPGVIFSDLYLEKLKVTDDGKIMLFATEDENVTITTTSYSQNGGVSRRTKYENRKGDILTVCLNRNGTFNWKSKIERRITYDRLYVRDIQVAIDQDFAYMTYADRYNKGGSKNFFNRRSKKDMRDFLNYAKIGIKEGNQQLLTYKINASNSSKENLKFVDASKVSEIDNIFYLDGFNVKVKPMGKIISCATIPLCGVGCLYYFVKFRNGSLFKGGGFLGSMKLKE